MVDDGQVMTKTIRTQSCDETMAVGQRVGMMCEAGDVIALCGELGAGKTQFVRGLAMGLGVDADAVSSPTYVLMQEYERVLDGGGEEGVGGEMGEGDVAVLVHIDGYRLNSLDELESMGFDVDELGRQGVMAIEWAQRMGPSLDGLANVLDVMITHVGESSRSIELSGRGVGGGWEDRLGNWEEGAKTMGTCPACGGAVRDEQAMPFCSARCRMIDLGKWFGEDYQISRPIEEGDWDGD